MLSFNLLQILFMNIKERRNHYLIIRIRTEALRCWAINRRSYEKLFIAAMLLYLRILTLYWIFFDSDKKLLNKSFDESCLMSALIVLKLPVEILVDYFVLFLRIYENSDNYLLKLESFLICFVKGFTDSFRALLKFNPDGWLSFRSFRSYPI